MPILRRPQGLPCFTRNGHPCQVHKRRVDCWRRLHPELPPPWQFMFVDGQYIPVETAL